jgi:hypothetical protein
VADHDSVWKLPVGLEKVQDLRLLHQAMEDDANTIALKNRSKGLSYLDHRIVGYNCHLAE